MTKSDGFSFRLLDARYGFAWEGALRIDVADFQPKPNRRPQE
jgi:hypothetical protein